MHKTWHCVLGYTQLTMQEAIHHKCSAVMPRVKQVQHVSVCAVHEGLKLCKANIAILVKHISFPYCSLHGIGYLQQVQKHICAFQALLIFLSKEQA